MIKTIIFDYAGVITPTKNNYIFAKKYHKRFGLTTKELMTKSYNNWRPALISKTAELKFWRELSQELNIDSEELRDLIIKTFPIDSKVIEIIDKIKVRYKIVMLSNQVESWLEKVIDENNLRNKFHYFINSYNVGIKKPNKKIFLTALEKSGSKPEETLFIDDSEENIKAAQELGIQCIKYVAFEQFLKEFNRYLKS